MFEFTPAEETVHVLSADPTGEARVTFRKWTAGQQLAYQDAMMLRAITKDEAGETAARLGVLNRLHLASVAVSATGFGLVSVVRDGVASRETFNPRLEEHLDALPAAVFTELQEAAQAFQPVPRTKPKDEKASAGEDGTATTEPVDDPFPAPPTQDPAHQE